MCLLLPFFEGESDLSEIGRANSSSTKFDTLEGK